MRSIDHPKSWRVAGAAGQFDRDEETRQQPGQWNSLLSSRGGGRWRPGPCNAPELNEFVCPSVLEGHQLGGLDRR